MGRTRIKICGITRPQDAAAAARLGADAIGMIFYDRAPRGITREVARQILAVLPPFVSPVGVFVDEEPQAILDAAAELNLRHVQLNGEESPAVVAELAGLTVIKAIRVTRDGLRQALERWRSATARDALPHVRGLVLETGATAEAGGSGVPNDWNTVREAQAGGWFKGLPPIIAAAGLRPETVGDVVLSVRPWAVDVSSGVEATKGQKSEELIADFVRAVRDADDADSPHRDGPH